jgi:hypothetical protein
MSKRQKRWNLNCCKQAITLTTWSMTVMAILQQLTNSPRETGIGRGRQFASMCRATIVRMAPAISVITATTSVARFA